MKLAIILLAAAVAHAQNVYTAVYEATPSGAAAVSTIQQPAAPRKNATLISVRVYSSVEVAVTLEHSGTAATATASTSVTKRPGSSEAPTLAFYTGSDAGAGSVWDKATILAGTDKQWSCTTPVTAGWCGHIPKFAGANWTVRTASMTGTVRVSWIWRED